MSLDVQRPGSHRDRLRGRGAGRDRRRPARTRAIAAGVFARRGGRAVVLSRRPPDPGHVGRRRRGTSLRRSWSAPTTTGRSRAARRPRCPGCSPALLVGVALGCRRRGAAVGRRATRSPRPTPSRSTPAPTSRSSLCAAFGLSAAGAAARRRSPSSAGSPRPPSCCDRRAAARAADPARARRLGRRAGALVADHPADAPLRAGDPRAVRVGRAARSVQSRPAEVDPAGRSGGPRVGRGRWCCSSRRLDMLALGDDTARCSASTSGAPGSSHVLLAVLLLARPR